MYMQRENVNKDLVLQGMILHSETFFLLVCTFKGLV